MRAKILKNEAMSMTGSKVFVAIQDKETPYIDLLVRESIQNSVDAVLEDKPYVDISFNQGDFENSKFMKLFEHETDFKFPKRDEINPYLAICDKNTTGLLGTHKVSKTEKQNLRNLVYDIMNKNGKSDTAGGSWGIGKSVYYRFGAGFCIYYSRTFEDNKYQNKLAIVFLEDETKENTAIQKENNRGIAFFGEIDSNDEPMPIYDIEEIKSVLSIFKEDVFMGEDTGTKVIIPYLELSDFKNRINDERCGWNGDFSKSLEVAVQRWYFARLNNKSFKGKYLRVKINGKVVENNKFFSIMQNMYNNDINDIKDAYAVQIKSDRPLMELGILVFKKFSEKEVMMHSPDNYPSPKCMFDIYRESNLPIIGYMRKPGMVITYDEILDNLDLGEDEFVIGFFILNDECEYSGENLGAYIRATEKANHKKWEDSSNNKDFPQFSEKKPVNRIWKKIKEALKAAYKPEEALDTEQSNSKLRKKLGKLLLPPSGFGDGADIGRVKGIQNPSGATKKNKVKIEHSGFEDGKLVFNVSTFLEFNDEINFEINIKSCAKKYTFEEWTQMGFAIPFKMSNITIYNVKIGKDGKRGNLPLNFDELPKDSFTIAKVLLACFEKSTDGKYCGIVFKNAKDTNEAREVIQFNFKIWITPLDPTYSISIDSKVMSKVGA